MVREANYGRVGTFLAFVFGLLAVSWSAEALAGRYAAILIEADSGRVLHEENADTPLYPASLTKMMTLYLLFEELEAGRLTLDSRLKISARAAGMAPSKLGLKAGQRIAVEDAIMALVTKSANDVAVAVAEALAGSEIAFAKRMTAKARALGMSRTTFRNASGLPNKHQKSTARDMARLSLALLRDHPRHYRYFSTSSFDYGGRSYLNHNSLLDDYRGVDGIKTGYIRQSGFNLAASAERDGRRLIAVVFGGKSSRSRDRHIASLLDRGFSDLRVAKAEPQVSPPPAKPLQLAASDALASGEGDLGADDSEGGLGLVSQARAATDPAGDWAVQVGAFRSHDPAYRLALKAQRLAPSPLAAGEVAVTRSRGNSGLYRARIAGLDRPAAEQACKALTARSMPCLVLRSGRN